MTAKWHERRFSEDARKVKQDCEHCGVAMWFPPSKAGKYLTCSPNCAEARRLQIKQQRTMACLTCSKIFIPRAMQVKQGQGKYCCVACSVTAISQLGNSAEARLRAAASRRQSAIDGKFVYLVGPANGKWRGGKEAFLARQKLKDPEVRRAKRRAYVAKNKDKYREYGQNRRAKFEKPLPRGTVKRIGQLQRWTCTVCRVDIKNDYHVDHVIPLANGGRHHPLNIQLLCPTCNTRESAKDPIRFMQQMGYLL